MGDLLQINFNEGRLIVNMFQLGVVMPVFEWGWINGGFIQFRLSINNKIRSYFVWFNYYSIKKIFLLLEQNNIVGTLFYIVFI